MKGEHAKNGTRRVGGRYEALACIYLQRQGLRLVERNYLCRMGEIDLIFRDGETLVFVEVRYRRDCRHGHAIETISARKQHRIIRTALHYLQNKGLAGRVPCRFDVIGVTGTAASPVCHWVRNAFQ